MLVVVRTCRPSGRRGWRRCRGWRGSSWPAARCARWPPGRRRRCRRVVRPVRLDELLGLHEHAARAAARVVDPALRTAPGPRRAARTTLAGCRTRRPACPRRGRTAQEVLVDLAQQVPRRLVALAAEAGVADQVDEFAEAPLVDVVPVEDLREGAGQGGLAFMTASIAVVERACRRRPRALARSRRGRPSGRLGGTQKTPARCTRRGRRGSRPSRSRRCRSSAVPAELASRRSSKASETYLRKTRPRTNVLVLGGVHGATELVGGLPQDVLDLLGAGDTEQFALSGGRLACGEASFLLPSLRWMGGVGYVRIDGSGFAMVSVPSARPAIVRRVGPRRGRRSGRAAGAPGVRSRPGGRRSAGPRPGRGRGAGSPRCGGRRVRRCGLRAARGPRPSSAARTRGRSGRVGVGMTRRMRAGKRDDREPLVVDVHAESGWAV